MPRTPRSNLFRFQSKVWLDMQCRCIPTSRKCELRNDDLLFSDFAVVSVIEYCSKTRGLLPSSGYFDNKKWIFCNHFSFALRLKDLCRTRLEAKEALSMNRQLYCCDGTNNNLPAAPGHQCHQVWPVGWGPCSPGVGPGARGGGRKPRLLRTRLKEGGLSMNCRQLILLRGPATTCRRRRGQFHVAWVER